MLGIINYTYAAGSLNAVLSALISLSGLVESDRVCMRLPRPATTERWALLSRSFRSPRFKGKIS
jgi:hypothetical protein